MLDASGVSAAEDAALRGIERVGAADEIVMGDRTINTEELLDDKNLKSKSDDLIGRLQADPENVEEILADWIDENPGMEGMAKWVSEQYADLTEKGEKADSTSELIKKKTEASEKFVDDNEVLGPAGKTFLKGLGFAVDGFGMLGNDPTTNKQYQELVEYANNIDNKDKWDFFKTSVMPQLTEEDLNGLKGRKITDIIEGLSTEEAWQEFQTLKQLDNRLANIESYSNLADAMFSNNTGLRNLMADPKRAQAYLDDLKRLNEAESHSDFRDAIKEFERLFDTDGDGKIDDINTMKSTIEGMLGDGIDVSNFDKKEANLLSDIINQGTVDAAGIMEKKASDWESTTGAKRQAEYVDAQNFVSKIEAEQKYVVDPSPSTLYNSHPSAGKWKKAFDPGKLGPGHAQKAGAQIFSFLTKDPKNIDRMIEQISTGKYHSWWKKNIGLPNPRGNHSSQLGGMLRNIARAGGYKIGGGMPSADQIKAGMYALFGNDLKTFQQDQAKYTRSKNLKDTSQDNPYRK